MRSRMSIVPKLFSHWWETLDRPHRLMDQHFGMTLNPDRVFREVDRAFRDFDRHFPSVYYRPWADLMRENDNRGCSVVKADKDKFQVTLDVQQFKPEEVNVKIVDNCVVVEGKHEEKQDDHGMISRQFVRKYMIPEQCDIEKTTSTLSSDGVLTITAPRKPEALESKKEKPIKIEHTGKPAVENREEPKRIAQAQ
ncbi:protein lethal(2)essential for life-like [Chelonus insularis]|uniref:protein lethal(2)essential for life-like n=1 Tax=Chelonus insularis TaxID=460826 RepID=UPI00158F5975|nr:protein lethal(2)essential for life-like [Chelonus insularis]